MVVVVLVQGKNTAEGGGEVTDRAHSPVRGDQMLIIVRTVLERLMRWCDVWCDGWCHYLRQSCLAFMVTRRRGGDAVVDVAVDEAVLVLVVLAIGPPWNDNDDDDDDDDEVVVFCISPLVEPSVMAGNENKTRGDGEKTRATLDRSDSVHVHTEIYSLPVMDGLRRKVCQEERERLCYEDPHTLIYPHPHPHSHLPDCNKPSRRVNHRTRTSSS